MLEILQLTVENLFRTIREKNSRVERLGKGRTLVYTKSNELT